MASTTQNGPQLAGDISIQDLTLIGANGKTFDISSFMIELNIYEDIFSPTMYGNILLSDSINVIEKLPIIGEEYLRIKVDTPGLSSPIYKTFRVYSVSDRHVVLDDKTQGFILHFCSNEVFVDSLNKLYGTFSGTISDVAGDIFQNYLLTGRNIVVDGSGNLTDSTDTSTLNVTDITSNKATFTSPGWGPLKCMSWLAAKSLSASFKSADFLFFESNKQFYFGSISSIINGYKSANYIAAAFYYKQSNIREAGNNVTVDGVQYTPPDLNREYSIAQNFTIVDQFNSLKNTNDGYYSSQMLSLNLTTKKYAYNNYDYGANFDTYKHTDKYPMFSQSQFRNPQSHRIVNVQQTNLYDGSRHNTNELAPQVMQNRISLLRGFSNLTIEMAVPGRTNFEVGGIVYFEHPQLGPKDESDATREAKDKYLSGLYLVTAVRHKISQKKHVMILSASKDSTPVQYK